MFRDDHPTMTPERAPRRRARWVWLGLAGAILIGLATFYGWALFIRSPLSDEERSFVGAWRLESPVFSPKMPELVSEMHLMSDHSMRYRIWDSRTRIVIQEGPSPYRWRVSNGRFQDYHPGHLLHGELGVGDATVMVTNCPVTWEDPDRFRLHNPSQFHPTQLWSRSDGP
jgi:hypothetical protein